MKALGLRGGVGDLMVRVIVGVGFNNIIYITCSKCNFIGYDAHEQVSVSSYIRTRTGGLVLVRSPFLSFLRGGGISPIYYVPMQQD